MDVHPRETRTLVLAAILALAVGAVAGVIGSVAVTTGSVGSLTRVFARSERSERNGPGFFAEELATIGVVRRASPAVVSIVVRSDRPSTPRGSRFEFEDSLEEDGASRFDEPRAREPVGGGSGFLVTSDGLILTNRHVVDIRDAAIAVVLHDNREFPATVVAKDPVHDLAVLRINAGTSLPVLALGAEEDVRIGETVIAIGYALSTFRNTVTKGVVSGVRRNVIAGDRFGTERIDEAIHTDAAINPGNSGGPLLNLRGEVIGMNTAVSIEGQLVGFALPVAIVREALESVVADGRIVRPWLGVRYVAVTPEIAERRSLSVTTGAFLVRGGAGRDAAVVPGSPADRAGLVVDDVITAVDGEPVTDEEPLSRRLRAYRPNDRAALTVYRNGVRREVLVMLGEFPGE